MSISDGEIEVAEQEAHLLHQIEDLDDVEFVDPRGVRARPRKQDVEAPPRTTSTEITVRTARPLPVKSKDLTARVEADLRLVAEHAFGKVSISEGDIQIGGRSWRVERARIDLDGSAPPRPVIDVLLVHEFETVVVSIFVTGTPDHPDVRFESSPATYDQAALLGIVLGADPDDPSGGGPLENKAAGAATGYVVGAIRSGLGQDLWLDTISFDLDERLSPRFSLGKWITRELFLGYDHHFGAREDENLSEGILRYRILPGWMVEGRFGEKTQGLDLFWTKRF